MGKRGKQGGMRRSSRSLQPSLQLARVSSFRGGKQRLALATSGTRLPRGPCPGTESLRSLEIPSLSALPTLSRIPPSRFSPLPFSFAFPFLSFPFLFFSSPLFSFLSVGSRDHRDRDRRKSSTGVVRRYRARYPGYGAPPPVRGLVHTRAHTRVRVTR